MPIMINMSRDSYVVYVKKNTHTELCVVLSFIAFRVGKSTPREHARSTKYTHTCRVQGLRDFSISVCIAYSDPYADDDTKMLICS